MGKPKSATAASSSQIEEQSSFIIKNSNHIISLTPDDYEPHIRVIIEFLSKHYLSIPLTKSPSNFTNRLLEIAHDHLKYIKETDSIKVRVTHLRYAPITKSIFLRAIGILRIPNHSPFKNPLMMIFLPSFKTLGTPEP